MPRGDKSSYSNKQKRMAEHIEQGYEKRGISAGEAERRAWATVNKETHGGKRSGSGPPKTILLQGRAVTSEERPRPRDRQANDQSRQKRLPLRASGTPSTTRITKPGATPIDRVTPLRFCKTTQAYTRISACQGLAVPSALVPDFCRPVAGVDGSLEGCRLSDARPVVPILSRPWSPLASIPPEVEVPLPLGFDGGVVAELAAGSPDEGLVGDVCALAPPTPMTHEAANTTVISSSSSAPFKGGWRSTTRGAFVFHHKQ